VRASLQEGIVVTDYIAGDRQFNVRVRRPQSEMTRPRDVESVLLFARTADRPAVYLGDVARVEAATADRHHRVGPGILHYRDVGFGAVDLPNVRGSQQENPALLVGR